MLNTQSGSAAERNRQPILEVIRQVLPVRGNMLEIASGTGQHAAWFAAALPGWTWQPTDADVNALTTIEALTTGARLSNMRRPLLLDVRAPQWPSDRTAFTNLFDAVYCANMLHIAPWVACAALMRGSARHLTLDGLLITYGPYREQSVPTAPGNTAFDQSLRARDATWGIRHLEDVATEAGSAGFRLRTRYAMPANNLLLVFDRRPDGDR